MRKCYKFDANWLYNIDKNFLWIYVKCQAVLRILYDMEADPKARTSYIAGLRSNAKSASKSAGDYNLYNNSANYPFTSADWKYINMRLIALTRPHIYFRHIRSLNLQPTTE